MSTDVPGPRDFAAHLVELTAAPSVFEAEELAARLRGRGVIALANAESEAGSFRAFVLVAAVDLERARAMVQADHPPEGAASREQIERDFERLADTDDEEELGDDWLQRHTKVFTKAKRFLLMLLAGGIAWSIAAQFA